MEKDSPRSVLEVPVQVSDDGSVFGVWTGSKQWDLYYGAEDGTGCAALSVLHETQRCLADQRQRVAAAPPAHPALARNGNAARLHFVEPRHHSLYEQGHLLQQRRLREERERDQKPWTASATTRAYTASDRITYTSTSKAARNCRRPRAPRFGRSRGATLVSGSAVSRAAKKRHHRRNATSRSETIIRKI